jgi:hypothetical protein
LPLGSAPAAPFRRPRRFSLHPAPPDILSDLVSPHGISPRFRAFSGWCRFSSHRASLPGFRTATFARFNVPLRVSLLSGGTCHCRLSLPPYPSSGFRGFSLRESYRWLRTHFRITAVLLAPCPFWDFCPSEISPFAQLPPSRASCSPAFSQGCEALLQAKVPDRDPRNCRPGWCLSRDFNAPQFSLAPDILPPPAGSRHILGPARRVFPAGRPTAPSRAGPPLCVSSPL